MILLLPFEATKFVRLYFERFKLDGTYCSIDVGYPFSFTDEGQGKVKIFRASIVATDTISL